MVHKYFFYLIYLVFILPVIASSQTASFKSDSTLTDSIVYRLDEVVVTGTRYEKKIIDIPYPVSRVDNEEFRFTNRLAVDDVLDAVPGLFLQSRYGNHDVRISIRGFGSRSNSGIRGVRILLDGIPESEPDGQTRIEAIDFNSIGRIEIVKGNASSLYPNSPGGVVNFINDTYFPRSMVQQFNDIGSFGLRRHGIKTGYRTNNYTFLFTYSNHQYDGYRQHNNENWHIINSVLETTPTSNTTLQILGYYVDGQIELPGSLTLEEYQEDPWQAAQREVDFDFRRFSKKGRVAIRFSAFLDNDRNNEIEVTGYGTIKYFERTTRVFRIINREGLGLTARYVRRNNLFSRDNEFSIGGDWQIQNGPIEFYENLNGQKGDILTDLQNKKDENRGFFFQNNIDIYNRKLYVMFTGRYDWVSFDWKNRILGVQDSRKSFEGFTPKVALNYKVYPNLSVYASYASSFRSPAGNELDNPPTPISSKPGELINPDLQPQESDNFELGVKGTVNRPGYRFFSRIQFETAIFHYVIDQEIVPFEINGEYFFQNTARTIRDGLELGMSVAILKPLQLQVAYTFSDFVYDKYSAERYYYDNQFNLILEEQDYAENQVPSVPRHNVSASLKLEKSLIKNLTGFSKLGLWRVSGMYVDDANSSKTEDFQVINFAIGCDYVIGRFNVLISGGVQNLLDDTYVGFININSASGRFYEAGSPRNYFSTVKLGLLF